MKFKKISGSEIDLRQMQDETGEVPVVFSGKAVTRIVVQEDRVSYRIKVVAQEVIGKLDDEKGDRTVVRDDLVALVGVDQNAVTGADFTFRIADIDAPFSVDDEKQLHVMVHV